MNYLLVLGRQAQISLAELEALFGAPNLSKLGPHIAKISYNSDQPFPFTRLGGSLKVARLLDCDPITYLKSFDPALGKFTIGFSDYSAKASKATSWRYALKIKQSLKPHGYSIRLVPNQAAALSTATSFHNKLGLDAKHLEIIRYKNYFALSVGVQNIDLYGARDQARPARDAKVGMLPPKLAQILINLATQGAKNGLILDPFCGTGVLLQEALLMGYPVIGSDLSSRILGFSARNLDWLKSNSRKFHFDQLPSYQLYQGDATTFSWPQKPHFIASEIYLGAPLSHPPSASQFHTLKQQAKTLTTDFLANLAPKITAGTTLALALPAWLRQGHHYESFSLVDAVAKLGYNILQFKHAAPSDLLYYREGQIVARQIIVLRKK